MENMEKEFDVGHCDLTIAENKEKFLKACLGDIYDAIQHEVHPAGIPNIELKVGMLYNEHVSLDSLKEDFKWREIGMTYKRQGYIRSYIVENLPTGKWNIITPCKWNWPSEGEGAPGYNLVGVLDWNAETRKVKFEGIVIGEEQNWIAESQKCEGNLDDEDFWFTNDDIIIYWKSRSGMMPAFSSQCDWGSEQIMNAAIAKYVQHWSKDLLRSITER